MLLNDLLNKFNKLCSNNNDSYYYYLREVVNLNYLLFCGSVYRTFSSYTK